MGKKDTRIGKTRELYNTTLLQDEGWDRNLAGGNWRPKSERKSAHKKSEGSRRSIKTGVSHKMEVPFYKRSTWKRVYDFEGNIDYELVEVKDTLEKKVVTFSEKELYEGHEICFVEHDKEYSVRFNSEAYEFYNMADERVVLKSRDLEYIARFACFRFGYKAKVIE